jgi:hypothetical protein
MAAYHAAIDASYLKEPGKMLQAAFLLAFCLLMTLVALGACAWVAATGQLFTMDGLLLIAISLSLGGAFFAMLLYSWKTGEVRAILNELRGSRKRAEGGGPQEGGTGGGN